MKGLPENPAYMKVEERGYGDIATDYGRAAAQGITFGFADEIEAYVRAALEEGAEYEDVVAEVRQKIDKFREDNPAAAWGVEIAASVIPVIAAQFIPGFGQAAGAARVATLGSKLATSPTARAAVTSGGQGALYGAGVAEGDIGERLESAAIAGPIAALGGAGMQRVAPHITSGAQDLIKRGVSVTAGQAVRGSSYLGTALGRLEEQIAGTVPFVGDAIRAAFDRSRVSFNRASVNEAFSTLGLTAPKDLEGTRLIDWAQKKMNQAYAGALKNMKMDDSQPLYEAVLRVSKDAHKDIRDEILDRAEGVIFKKFDKGGGVLSGDLLKDAQSRLRRDVKRLRDAGYHDERAARLADAMEDILGIFSNQLSKQNPKLAARLNAVDRAYGKVEIVRNAALRRQVQEEFTPGDLLRATAKGDTTRRRSQFSAGRARMQPFAQTAQDVLGQTVADSGTAGRQMAAKLLTGGGLGAGVMSDWTVAVPIIGGLAGAYSRMGVPMSRTAVDVAGRGMRQAVPVMAAQAPQTDLPETAKLMLARALSAARR